MFKHVQTCSDLLRLSILIILPILTIFCKFGNFREQYMYEQFQQYMSNISTNFCEVTVWKGFSGLFIRVTWKIHLPSKFPQMGRIFPCIQCISPNFVSVSGVRIHAYCTTFIIIIRWNMTLFIKIFWILTLKLNEAYNTYFPMYLVQ